MVYSTLELDSHADTIFCYSNFIIINFTGKEWNAVAYTVAYKKIKAVPIVQAVMAYDNPDTGETNILILNEATWMGTTMDHTLVNSNKWCAYSMTVQYNPFSEAPSFIATYDHGFMIPLSSKETIPGFNTKKTHINGSRHAHMSHLCQRMSGIHIMFASPRASLPWRRKFQGTLEQ